MDCERLKKKRKILEKDINIYPDLDNIKGPVVMADFPTHSAPQMKIDKGKISNEKGYRLAKSSHGVWEGSWYFEVLLENSVNNLGHVRIGWSQISGDLQAPCGYDAFSYSWRDAPGTLFHQSCAVKDAPGGYAGGYKPGDVIGVYIHLPPLTDLNRLELQKRLWNPLVDKEYVQIRSRPLQHVRNSEIRYFKNGVDMGVAFSPIYFGKYHAAISCYMGGKVSLNFGPKFKFPLKKGRPLSQASNLVFAPEIAPLLEQDILLENEDVKTELDEKVSDQGMQAVLSNENTAIEYEHTKDGNDGMKSELEDSAELSKITQDVKN